MANNSDNSDNSSTFDNFDLEYWSDESIEDDEVAGLSSPTYRADTFLSRAPIITQADLSELQTLRVNNTELHPQIINNSPTRRKILWLLGPGNNDKRKDYIRNAFQRIAPHLKPHLRFIEVNDRLNTFFSIKAGTKSKKIINPDYATTIHNQLSGALATARIIVLNDFSALAATLHSTTGHGTKTTLSVFRGSTYINKLWHGIPAYVIEDASKNYGWQPPSSSSQEHTQLDNIQFFDIDINRIAALYKNPTSAEDEFDNRFRIINAPYHYSEGGDPRLGRIHHDYPERNDHEFREWLANQTLLALDYETARSHITCLSITGISNHDISTMQTWVLPQANPHPYLRNNLHMSPAAFHSLHKAVLEHDCPKIWHNGNYDLQYTVAYSNANPVEPILPRGIQHDTMLLWHSFRAQLPQSLATLASIFSPSYYYWKDEIKGASTSRERETVGSPVPLDRLGYLTYLRYAGLDTWNTLLGWWAMVEKFNVLASPEVLTNYIKELALMRGPLLHVNIFGCELSRANLASIVEDASTDRDTAARDLVTASGGYLSTSTLTPERMGDWLYNILGATPELSDQKRMAKARKANKKATPSTNAKVLRLVGEKHPIHDYAVDLMREYTRPKKLAEMYSGLRFPIANGRARLRTNYSLRPYTGRLSSTGSAFWDGTNVQNIPANARHFCTASPGHILLDIDYSQADSYHFAVACGDPKMLHNTFSPDDTHSRHVEMIFKLPYEEVLARRKSPDKSIRATIDHPITGLRQIIKKLCHGGNYGMLGESAYANAGRDALLASAKLLNISTSGWTRDDFYKFIDYLLSPYFSEYNTMLPWRDTITAECIANHGWATCAGGHSCYFPAWEKPRERASLTRALLAFYGQGGTGAMVNKAMHRLYFGSWNDDAQKVIYQQGAPSILDQFNSRIVFQTHDSFTFDIPISSLTTTAINAIYTAMELPNYFNSREYIVPVEGAIGYTWSKNMIEVTRTTTQADLTIATLDRIINEHPALLT